MHGSLLQQQSKLSTTNTLHMAALVCDKGKIQHEMILACHKEKIRKYVYTLFTKFGDRFLGIILKNCTTILVVCDFFQVDER